jgi:hypothetical protein
MRHTAGQSIAVRALKTRLPEQALTRAHSVSERMEGAAGQEDA